MRREEVVAKLSQHMDELSSRHRVEGLSIFGSTARGESSSSSDVDLLVDFVGDVDYDLFINLKLYLEELLQCRVDLVTRAALRSGLRESVEREAVRVA
jgi:hypothetical protein